MKILYILPFKNGLHFKIGVTSDPNRLFTLDKSYGIDLEKGEFVYSEINEAVVVLEKLLKITWSELVEEYKGINGWKEVRNISIYKNLKKDIVNQNRKLKYKFFNYKQVLKFIGKIHEETRGDRIIRKHKIKIKTIFLVKEEHYVFYIKGNQLELHSVELDLVAKKISSTEVYYVEDFNPVGAKSRNTLYVFSADKKYVFSLDVKKQIKYTEYTVN